MVRGRSKWLAELINTHKYSRGAEVGAAIGLTTSYVLRNCPSIEEYVVADDWRVAAKTGPFSSPTMKKEFDVAVAGFQNKLTILQGISWEQAEWIENESLDFVFIDASHDYESVKKDIISWAPKVRAGGLLSGHDVNWPGVQKALKELYPDFVEPKINEVWFKYMK